MIHAKIVEDSISEAGARLVTLSLVYPRFIHSEVMTHRVFSRNAASSRAIPVEKMLRDVRTEPALPIYWGKNQKGMQAAEALEPDARQAVLNLSLLGRDLMCLLVEKMNEIGLHKQTANRYIEPWQHMSTIITSTEWPNFKNLRVNKNAQPEFFELASEIMEAIDGSKPTVLKSGEWHLPYVIPQEKMLEDIDAKLKFSTARCARVSLKNQEGEINREKDAIRYWDLLASGHMSPFEHQGTPADRADYRSGNFRGWIQHRKLIPGEEIFQEDEEAINARKNFKAQEALDRLSRSLREAR